MISKTDMNYKQGTTKQENSASGRKVYLVVFSVILILTIFYLSDNGIILIRW